MISGTTGISRLELKTTTVHQQYLMYEGKTCVKHKENKDCSGSFKNELVKISNQRQQKAYGHTENGFRRINMFPWGGDKFSVTKNRHTTSRVSYTAAVTNTEVPN